MRTLPAAILAIFFATVLPGAAKDEWAIGHGPFVTAADVRDHNRAALDWRDLKALVDRAQPDWPAALTLYAYGRHFKNHSLGIVADDYNGRFGAVLPLSSRHFGTPSFQALQWNAALMRTSRFRRTSDADRVAFLGGAAPALMINWARYELAEAERKAKAARPNWALTNGSPKNWNEIFAFYYGPGGKDSVFEAVTEAGQGALNERLFAALAEGQDALVKQAWPAEAARRTRDLLDQASLVLLRHALSSGLDTDPSKARLRASGAWMAAAEAALASPGLAAAIEPALAEQADATASRTAIEALSRAIAP
ncbi:hypothetical protein [Enterovirga rhinocerotis]|uniref:Uncharacterized protein n=1 Tax=Enterovirga rhinocerotis TaxID=1339210 RepID=A0A4R7CCE7_9HYPH|nr:hypothetical protein [Enterovirga rhinocerotis]TDR94826.1 hypothetical protein EV668_2115 [Enterovirga rhinocerotis]